MPKPPKPVSELDQSKVGLQDDHDPRDPAQKQNDKSKGECEPPKQPAGSDRDKKSGGKVDTQGLPDDESSFG